MGNYNIAIRANVAECVGSRLVRRPQKRWIDIVKDCLKKRGLDVRRARNMIRVNGGGVCEGVCLGST